MSPRPLSIIYKCEVWTYVYILCFLIASPFTNWHTFHKHYMIVRDISYGEIKNFCLLPNHQVHFQIWKRPLAWLWKIYLDFVRKRGYQHILYMDEGHQLIMLSARVPNRTVFKTLQLSWNIHEPNLKVNDKTYPHQNYVATNHWKHMAREQIGMLQKIWSISNPLKWRRWKSCQNGPSWVNNFCSPCLWYSLSQGTAKK